MNLPSFTKVEIFVLTYKDGLLSAVAHDLRLVAGQPTVDFKTEHGPETRCRVTIDSGSLRVVYAEKDGTPQPGTLSPGDCQKIEQNIRQDVLHSGRFPQILFEGTLEPLDDDWRATGTLTLHGVANPFALTLKKTSEGYEGRSSFDQRRFGVTPYSAMFGTLKVKPEVTLEVRVSAG